MNGDTEQKINAAISASEARMIGTLKQILEKSTDEILDRIEAIANAQISAAGSHAATLKSEIAAARKRKARA